MLEVFKHVLFKLLYNRIVELLEKVFKLIYRNV